MVADRPNTSSWPGFLRDRRFVAAMIVLVTLLVHATGAVLGGFHSDDAHGIVENEGIRSLGNVPRFFADPQLWSSDPGNSMYCPLLRVTYALDHAILSAAPPG